MPFSSINKALDKGWPTFDDLEKDRVFIDKRQDGKVNKIKNKLSEKRFCLIRGAEGRGKTVLARIVGYQLAKPILAEVGFRHKIEDGFDVMILDISELDREIDERTINLINGEIVGMYGNKEKKRSLFVFENANFRPNLTEKILQFAKKETEISHFLFTARKLIPDEDGFINDPFVDWEEKGLCIDLDPDLYTIEGIINNYISNNPDKFLDSIHESPTEEDKNWAINVLGSNLRKLDWHLKAWDPKSTSLREVSRDEVLEKVREELIIPLGKRNTEWQPDLEDELLNVAAVYQFDVGFIDEKPNKYLRELLKQGIIGYREPAFVMQHPTDANYIVEASAARGPGNPSKITIEHLKKYLSNKPRNYDELFSSLYQEKEEKNREILEQVIHDHGIFKIIKEQLVNGDDFKKLILSIFYPIYWATPDRAKELWFFYKESLGKNAEKAICDKLKLNQTSLSTISFFLLFLKRVELDKAIHFASDLLQTELLVNKARNAEFTIIATIVNLIYRLVPEESEFFQDLNKKALDIIKNLDPSTLGWKISIEKPSLYHVNDVLIIMLKAEDGDKMVTNFLSKIDPNDFGKSLQTKNINPQGIYFFLYYLRKQKDWAYNFLEGLGKENLVNIFRSAKYRSKKNVLKLIKIIDSELHSYLYEQLFPTPKDKVNFLLQSGINAINQRLWEYLRHQVKIPEERIQDTVTELSSQDLDEKIRKLYQNPDIEKPLEILGKFLRASNQISYRTHPDTVKKITQQVVETFNNLELPSNYTLEELSLLALNVYGSNGKTFQELMNEILSSVDLESFIKTPVVKGLGRLLWLIYQYDLPSQYNKTNYQRLLDKVLQLDLTEILKTSDIEAVSDLLWNTARIDITRTRKWMENVEQSVWVEVITKKIKEASREPAKTDTSLVSLFWLLCQLYQIDITSDQENLGCKVAYDAYPLILEVLSAKPKLQSDELPLLGLLKSLYNLKKSKVDLKELFSLPSYSVADKLTRYYSIKQPGVMQLAFSIRCLHDLAPDLLIKDILHEYTMRYPEYIQESVDHYPFPHMQNNLREILFSENLNRTQEEEWYFTSTKMILLTQTCFETIGLPRDPVRRDNRTFSDLLYFFIFNPEGNPLFKGFEQAKKQVYRALEQGIYHSKVEQLHSDQNKKPIYLRLNHENHIVTSTLNIAKSLITVLNKVAAKTKSISSKDWEEALSKDPLTSSIDSAELEYFKRLLLWTGTIKEEYMGNTPLLSLQYNHPLVKIYANENSHESA